MIIISVQFKDNSAAVKAQMDKNIAKTLESIGLHWQRRATEEATAMGVVDTGRFRASLSYITPEKESGLNSQAPKAPDSVSNDALSGRAPEKTVIVGSNVSYSVPLELGTAKTTGRPTIRNSVLNYQSEYQEIATKNLGEGFEVKTNI